MIKDNTISVILGQISYIIDQLMSFDFSFDEIVNTAYDGNNVAQFITTLFDDQNYFYNFYKTDITNAYIRPNIITNIRLLLQPNGISDDVLNTFIKEEQ